MSVSDSNGGDMKPSIYLLLLDDVSSGQEVFFEDFTGGTVFTETAYPFGDPISCAHSNEVNFSNLGTEHQVQMGCYDEAEMSVTLGLPSDNYTITVSWSTGADPHTYSRADLTHFDEQYGAGITVPMRIVVVNGAVVDEVAGQLTNYTATSVIPYTGPITTLTLGINTAGYDPNYYTWYDYVKISH